MDRKLIFQKAHHIVIQVQKEILENHLIKRKLEKVLVVHYDKMMSDFEALMEEVLTFIDAEPTAEMIQNIRETAESQSQYKSGHRYDLEKFGLSAERIKKDCTRIYQTFLN